MLLRGDRGRTTPMSDEKGTFLVEFSVRSISFQRYARGRWFMSWIGTSLDLVSPSPHRCGKFPTYDRWVLLRAPSIDDPSLRSPFIDVRFLSRSFTLTSIRHLDEMISSE